MLTLKIIRPNDQAQSSVIKEVDEQDNTQNLTLQLGKLNTRLIEKPVSALNREPNGHCLIPLNERTSCKLGTLETVEESLGERFEQREEVRMDQTPREQRWALTPLYKMSVNGGLLYWQIGFDGMKNLEMSHGYADGVIRTDTTEVRLNVARRNIQEQALLEARQRYRLKYREGYQPAGSTTTPLVKAMKGYEYKPSSIKYWPVYTQPKLNGIRMLCQNMGLQAGLQTMGNNRISALAMRSWLNNVLTNLTHLEPELIEFFEYLPKNATLDGELYNHNMDFTVLTSAVKTVKSVHSRLHEVQYWIFDINYEDTMGPPPPYERRYELLIGAYQRYIQDQAHQHLDIPERDPSQAASSHISGESNDVTGLSKVFRIVPSEIARNHEEILQQHDRHVAVGYEGIMIKKISNGSDPGSKQYSETLYKAGKGNHILKYKQFIDEEAMVINVTEAEGTEKGAAMLIVLDRRGNQFQVRMRGDMERRRIWYQNPELIIGKEITIRYQELSIYGVPRFPIGVAVRDYE